MTSKLLGLGLSLLLALSAGTAWGGEVEFDTEWSGTFVDTAIDTNNDGSFANLYQLAGKGGSETTTGIFEVEVVGFTEACGGYPMLEVDYILNTGVTRYKNDDLLFFQMVEGSGCINYLTGVGSGGCEFTVLGGTGRFSGATGHFQDHAMSFTLVANPTDPLNPTVFGAISGRSWGTVYTVDE